MTRRQAVIALVGLAVGYLATGFFQVLPGEQAIVRRFGKVLDHQPGPGLHWGLPWGLDRVDRVAVDGQRELTVGFVETDDPNPATLPVGMTLTGDNNLINLRATVYFQIDPERVATFVLNRDRAELRLARLAEETLVLVLAGERVDAILLGQARSLEARLAAQLAARVRQQELGIVVTSVNLTYAQVPNELAEVFREVNRARSLRDLAEREAASARAATVSLARQECRKLAAEASAAATEKVAKARAEAAAFHALYHSLPEPGLARMNALLHLYLTEMQAVLERMPVRVIADSGVDQIILWPATNK